MAAKHYARDVFISDPQDYNANGNDLMANAILFHFLRTAGWSWLWECDGEVGPNAFNPNHVPDGNMETAGVGNWTEVGGASIGKETTGVATGTQRLRVTALQAGDGVESDPLAAMTSPSTYSTVTNDALIGPVAGVMRLYDDSSSPFIPGWVNSRIVISGSPNSGNNGTFPIVDVTPIDYNVAMSYLHFYNPAGVAESYYTGSEPPPNVSITYSIQRRYELVVLAANNGGTWNVRVNPGTGSFATVGTIPNNGGVATLYRFTFYVQGSGDVELRFEATGSGALYLDGVNVHRSLFESWVWAEGTDGNVANGDEFYTGGSFTADSEVVGKHLFLWDEQNPENSGCYEILADVGGGSIQVDLRSQTFQFSTVSNDSIRWRIVQIRSIYNRFYEWQASAGFALESPHSSKWRFVLRQKQSTGQVVKGCTYWAAPEDTDFDFSTGHFYVEAGPSSLRNRGGTFNYADGAATRMHTWRGPYYYKTSPTKSQTFLMTDATGSFFHFIHFDTDGSGHGGYFVGYTRETPPSGFSEIETFAIIGPWSDYNNANAFYFDDLNRRIGYSSTLFRANELAIEGCVYQHGIGTSSSEAETEGGASKNAFTGAEWLRPLVIGRDPNGSEATDTAYFNMDEGIIYQGRANLPSLTPIGDDVEGTGDSITAGTPAYISDAAGDFTTAMIGQWVVIDGAPTANNNGVFKVTGVPDANTLEYTNPFASPEAAPAMTWRVSSFSKLHISNGWCIEWNGEALAA